MVFVVIVVVVVFSLFDPRSNDDIPFNSNLFCGSDIGVVCVIMVVGSFVSKGLNYPIDHKTKPKTKK